MVVLLLSLRKGLTEQKLDPLQSPASLPQHRLVTLANSSLAGERPVGCRQLPYPLVLAMPSFSSPPVLRGITL